MCHICKVAASPNLRIELSKPTSQSKSTHVHYEVPVNMEGVLGEVFRQSRSAGIWTVRATCQTFHARHALAESGEAHGCVPSSRRSQG